MQTKNKPASESQEYVILHEDDYRSEELTKELGHEVWIHKATGKITIQITNSQETLLKLRLNTMIPCCVFSVAK